MLCERMHHFFGCRPWQAKIKGEGTDAVNSDLIFAMLRHGTQN
jgi:hypothetical protein